jgi:hypothetical protein
MYKICPTLHLCTDKSPILGRFTSAKAMVTMRVLEQRVFQTPILTEYY